MELTPEQSCDILSTIFPVMDRSVLKDLLERNKFEMEVTIDQILRKSEPGLNACQSVCINGQSIASQSQITQPNFDSKVKVIESSYRGSKIQLPNDFLRIPGWAAKHREALLNKDFMTLFADPIFLREIEREFGPNYEIVLREHLKAEYLSYDEKYTAKSTKEPQNAQGELQTSISVGLSGPTQAHETQTFNESYLLSKFIIPGHIE